MFIAIYGTNIFTFKSKNNNLKEKIKFLSICGVQYMSNMAVISIGINQFRTSPELSGLIAIVIGVFISYTGHKFWSFKH